VNGILRAVARQKDNLPLPDKSKNPRKFYSVYYSIPLATVKYLISLLGEESAVAFFETVNSPERRITLTVNTEKISVDSFLSKLINAGYSAKRSEYSDISLIVSGSADPREIPGFSEGEFFVQDEASAVCASVLGAVKGELIIDTCSAPGGKSFALAVISGDEADIRSFDLHESKLSLISAGAERLSLKSVRAENRDATDPCKELFGKADAVLCDAPCSGLGVFSKKPDLRYKDITNLSELSELQYKILCESSKYLKTGGRLVYSTCTLRREENEDIVTRFLSENDGFEAEDFAISGMNSERGMLTLYQHVHKTDGFFISKLRKKK
jgi:16S rRNA (cytosine967-C5)-methyltransferase